MKSRKRQMTDGIRKIKSEKNHKARRKEIYYTWEYWKQTSSRGGDERVSQENEKITRNQTTWQKSSQKE